MIMSLKHRHLSLRNTARHYLHKIYKNNIFTCRVVTIGTKVKVYCAEYLMFPHISRYHGNYKLF
jgi:hypothetical protein